MEQQLCEGCAELCRRFMPEIVKHPHPWLHCHHNEGVITLHNFLSLDEKPKEKCWCDEPTFCYVIAGEKTIKAEFCPVCGKVQKEWGK